MLVRAAIRRIEFYGTSFAVYLVLLASKTWRHSAGDKQLDDNAASKDELAEISVAIAAAEFDSCNFGEAIDRLRPLVRAAECDPQQFTAQRRVEIFNTAGRVLIMLGEPGWDGLFEKSVELQQLIDPSSVRRTQGYLVHGWLRTNSLDKADELLYQLEQCSTGDSLADGFTLFYRCDLDRRRGQQTPGTGLDLATKFGYAGAFAMQAMARQANRTSEDAIDLLQVAEESLGRTECDDDNLLRFISVAISLHRAAISNNSTLWRQTTEWLKSHISRLGSFQERYFYAAIGEPVQVPDRKASEKLLDLLPYL